MNLQRSFSENSTPIFTCILIYYTYIARGFYTGIIHLVFLPSVVADSRFILYSQKKYLPTVGTHIRKIENIRHIYTYRYIIHIHIT